MEPIDILYPLLAMMALTFAAYLRLAWLRFGAFFRGIVPARYYKNFQGDAPEAMLAGERHIRHLFELPVIFYALGLIIFLTGQVSTLLVGLAWAFVATRVVHTVIHLSFNHPLWRFGFFFAGKLIVVVMWAVLVLALV